MAGIDFDRIADRYEETRGGLERGRRFAAVLDAHLPAGAELLEIGVGTGAVARPLVDLGHRVVGVDISEAMLARAADRAVAVTRADGTLLPFPPNSVDAVVCVWAVHAIPDRSALVAEVARVLRPGGHWLVVSTRPDVDRNDVMDLAYAMPLADRGALDRPEALAADVAVHGLAHVGDGYTDEYRFEESPEDRARALERRDFSFTWDLDDDTWAREVQPTIDALRALPDPERPRPCVHRHVLSCYRLEA